MLTVKTLQNIKRGAWFTIFNGIYAVLFGILYVALFSFILRNNFSAIDVVWQVFAKYNPSISQLIVKLMIFKGIFIITIGILIIYLSIYLLKKKDRDTWIMLFIIGLLFWPSLLTFEVLDGNWYTASAVTVGWITFIIGMLIPIKYYSNREFTDY
jgi:hypothetical protein